MSWPRHVPATWFPLFSASLRARARARADRPRKETRARNPRKEEEEGGGAAAPRAVSGEGRARARARAFSVASASCLSSFLAFRVSFFSPPWPRGQRTSCSRYTADFAPLQRRVRCFFSRPIVSRRRDFARFSRSAGISCEFGGMLMRKIDQQAECTLSMRLSATITIAECSPGRGQVSQKYTRSSSSIHPREFERDVRESDDLGNSFQWITSRDDLCFANRVVLSTSSIVPQRVGRLALRSAAGRSPNSEAPATKGGFEVVAGERTKLE